MLSKEEIDRYSKQLLLPEIGLKGQEKLKESRVLVVGAGGLGCPVLQYLAAAGVGALGIMDHDFVAESNLQRQVLYSVEDIGKPKAIVAAEKILKLNPYINPQAISNKLNTDNALEIISGYDMVADCSDNFETRYLINDVCVLLNKSFVYGGIYKFEGQLAVFNYKSRYEIYGPTYRCIFPKITSDEDSLNCGQTGVIGTLSGIIGTMQANEIIKMITGAGQVCSGKLLLFNALTNVMTEIKINRNESVWGSIPRTIDEFKNRNYFLSVKKSLFEKVK